MATAAVPSPIQTENPYVTHVDDEPIVREWQVRICSGCCDDCCSCFVPTFVPCIGIGEAACGAGMNRSDAILLAILFGLLVLGSDAMSVVFSVHGTKTETTYAYDSYYDSWTGTYYYYWTMVTTEKVVYTFAIISLVCSLIYVLGLSCFRGFFRGKLSIPGECCTDCVLSFFCSCCVVAQMRTHVKRGASGIDTLPAYAEVPRDLAERRRAG